MKKGKIKLEFFEALLVRSRSVNASITVKWTMSSCSKNDFATSTHAPSIGGLKHPITCLNPATWNPLTTCRTPSANLLDRLSAVEQADRYAILP